MQGLQLLSPVSNWGNSSRLSKEAIESRVNAHHEYLSARLTASFPRLVDLAAERLANLESLDEIPPVMLTLYIWRWFNLPYPAIYRAFLHLCRAQGANPDFANAELTVEGSTKNIDDWILLNEKWLRDDNQMQWQRGLVTLDDADNVFPNSALSYSGRIITRLRPLNGYEVLCDAREPQISIQPSVEAFNRTFEYMSDGLLRNLNWNNLFVAGGMILGTLLSVNTTPDGQPLPDPRWASSDIDIYVYGLSPTAANEKIKHLFDTFRANLPEGTPTLVARNCSTITFYARYPLRRIQIVLKLVESPKSVLLNFDLDVCAMGWDGSKLWMLPRAARALETGCNVFTMSLIHGHYLSVRRASTLERIFKYANKGYGIRILPSYIASLINRHPETVHNDNPSGAAEKVSLKLSSMAAAARENIVSEVKHGAEFEESFNVAAYNMSPKAVRWSLKGFAQFMRYVAIWEMAQRGEAVIDGSDPALGLYQDAMSTYADSPTNLGYKWDAHFNIRMFQHHIEEANTNEIWNWCETDLHDRLWWHGVESGEDLMDVFQRMTCAPTVDDLLSKKNDIMMQVLLPCEFAVYANDLVSRAQASAGLREMKLLMPAIRQFNFLGNSEPQADGLFFWRIGKDLMWQQLDRRIDEVFEVLHAFRKVNSHLHSDQILQEPRLRTELARRATYDEFDAFAQWVGSGPEN
ncbi:hypothetical protein C8R43DRAFT_924514 [Mycena crocata]|nr:hypothetical protein C8R43DRAFT_924514 [Mycena crocata]